MEIYQPAEDSYLFADFLKKYFTKYQIPNTKYLDIGTGSGILARTALKFLPPKNILASDINPDAIKALQKEKFQVIQSDLFQTLNRTPKFNKAKFDLITFNAPYLPLDPREPKSSRLATTGGKRGDELSLKFLKQAKQHLNPNGKIFLLISSLTPMDKIKKFNPKIVTRKKIFFEELLILEFTFS
ncbi:methyltransferase [Candidatus Pacearchaeota archaeon]|nr:methyltransferase [Candidatus Pacearchaeota archaeon]